MVIDEDKAKSDILRLYDAGKQQITLDYYSVEAHKVVSF
jgi:hypothetical protein